MIRTISSMSDSLQEDNKNTVNDKDLPQTRAAARVCICTCSLVLMALPAFLCTAYWLLWNQAIEFNSEQHLTQRTNPYNSCGQDMNTNWQLVLATNSIVYLLHCLMTLLICFGTLWFPLIMIGGISHCLGCLVQIVCIVLTAIYRFSDDGEQCAASKRIISDDRITQTTFENHGEAIKSLFVTQCALFLVYNCCVGALFSTAVLNSPLMSVKWKSYYNRH